MKSILAKVALRTSLLYVLVAGAWILLSDRVLAAFVSDPETLTRLDIYKDWAFVAVTALLIYTLLRGQLQHLDREAAERKQAEAELRNSEERHRAVLENQTEIICRFQADHTYTFVNDMFCRFFGKTRQELLGSKWLPEVLAEDLPLVKQKLQSLSPANPIVLIENRVRSGSGEMRWMQFSNRAFFDEQNRLVEIQAVGRDITERKQAEEALRNSERLLRSVMDLVPHFIFVKDQKSRHLLVNRACAEANNLTPEQMVGLCDRELAPDHAQAEAFMKDDQEVITSGRPKFTEEKLTDANGQTRILQTTKIPFPSSTISFPVTGNGKPAILGVAVDITARKLAEDVVHQKQAQLVEALRIARLAYWEYDVISDQFTFNDQFYSILHTTAEREGGYTMSSAEYAKRFVHPDDAAVVRNEVQKAIAATDSNYSREFDHRIIYGDGEVGYFNAYIRIQKDAQGRTIKTHGAHMDITERKRAEVQLVESRNYLDKIINSIADPMFVKDRQHRWVLLNDAYCDFMGHKREELLGKSDCDFFPKSEADVFWSKDEVVFTTSKENINEEEFTDGKGNTHTIMTKKALYTDEKGEKFIVGIIRDISERKHAEQDLQMFEFSIDQASDAIFWMTREAGFSYVNEQACRSLGYTREELMRLHLWDIDPVFPKERWDAEWKQFQENKQGGAQQLETLHRRKDGSAFPVSISSKHLWFGDTELHVAVARDITERKQAEAKLVEASALLEAMLNNSPLYIFFKDLQSRFKRVSKSLAHSLQVSDPESFKGKTDSDFFPATHARATREEEQKIIHTGQPLIDKLDSVVPSNGKRVWGLTTKLPWRDGAGNIVGTFGFTRDITAIKEAEDKLAHERQLLRTLIDLLPETFYIKDLDSRFLVANETLAKRFGKESPTQVLGLSDADFFPPATAAGFRAEEVKVLTGESLIDHEERVVFPDGRERTMLTTKVPFRDSQGRICGLVGIGRDITERKQVAEAIAHERQLLRTLIDLLPETFYIKDLDSHFLVANKALAKHFGKETPSQILGLTDADFFPAEAAAEFRAEELKVFDDEPIIDQECKGTSPTGRVCTHLTSKVPFRDSQGRICGLVGIGRDITERKQTEEANARLATAVEQAAEVIVITDPKGVILYVNPAFERITGYTSSEVIGRNPRILKSGKHDAAFYQQMWDTLSHGKVWTGRVINKKKNGAFYEEEMSISPVFDSNGKIANYVAVKRDVTQEMALETQLRQAQKMEIIGQLAGGVAHDFNNILTVIQGNASLLQNAELKPIEKTECTQQIVQAAERAASLTRQLLMFSRKQVMQPTNLSLNEVVAQMTKMLRRVLGENISLQSNYAANLPFIHGDPGMIEQILMNLVVNARDAMSGGGSLTITTGAKTLNKEQAEQSPGASPGLHVWLAVSDTGSGIAPENLPRIFEPFFTTKEVGKGTGLGLATVYGIVQQHHGWITVTSEVNQGTTFQIHFPAVVNPEPEKKAELLIS
ncbi:MAG: PAS domain S-box protein [Verrucomicrobiota bacterium]